MNDSSEFRSIATRAEQLAQRMAERGDSETAQRLRDLAARAAAEDVRVQVAFCGRFSAGKSSLINHLLDGAQLATGAVPTTQDVQTVACHTGDGVVYLMDTPGVDSTDERHQAVTFAALHAADVVALVMDYQNVEAEDNLELARQWTAAGKPLWLIVNQVDKHADWEVSFAEFRTRIDQTFADYGVQPAAVFYTSTRGAVHDETVRLRAALAGLARESERVLGESFARMFREAVEQHVKWLLAEQWETCERDLYDAVGYVPFDEDEAHSLLAARDEEFAALARSGEQRRSQRVEPLERLRTDALRAIELAQISPYETTEKGRLYVESVRPKFTVGWWNRQTRTEAERQRRLQEFVSDLADRTEKYLVWPVRNFLREFAQQAEWAPDRWITDVDEVTVAVTASDCARLIHEGALLSEQYPYQYVKDVAAHVKRRAVASVHSLIDKWLDEALAELAAATQDAVELDRLERERQALANWLALHGEQRQLIDDGLKLAQGLAEERAAQRV